MWQNTRSRNVTSTVFAFIVVSSLISVSEASISCKDHNDVDVDWFVVYKLPKLSDSTNQFVRNGSGWAYFGPSSSSGTWTLANTPVTDPNAAVGLNVEQIFDHNGVGDRAHILYNDQPPHEATVSTGGHTKGIILTDASKGVWVVHSIPHFPFELTRDTFFPSTGYINGQLFLCLSLPVAKIDDIGQILKYTRPNIFNYSIPTSMEAHIPVLTSVAKEGARAKTAPWSKLFQLDVANGLDFQIFAKGPKSKQEIYSNWISPKLQTSLDVQSWLNGPNPLPSNCTSQFSSYNILLKEVASVSFSTHQDHSKWAVGTSASNKWSCIGDLNRMEHQLSRGGASLCTSNGQFWNFFSTLEKSLQPCPRPAT